MSKKFLIINVLLLIYVKSAEFNLNSLNTTTKSLDTFNQTKITLNNTWDYKDAKGDGPITVNEIQQQQHQHKAKENGKLSSSTTTRMTAKNLTEDTHLTNEKPLKAVNIVKRPEPKNHQRNSNSNHFYHYLTTLEFNNRNNENSHDYNFNLNNKLKTITTYNKNDANEVQQNVTDVKENPAEQNMKKVEETVDNIKGKFETKFYVAANSFSKSWLGHLPQFPKQTQQLQLFLQQLPQQQSAARLLPHEYHHLADYRLLFNAERQTQFYLHTLTKQNDFVAVATKQATATLVSFEEQDAHNIYELDYNSNHDKNTSNNNHEFDDDDDDAGTVVNLKNPKHLNIVTDTIGAVFGVNTRPVAAIQDIHVEEIELYNGLSLRQSRFNPFNPCRILIHGWLGGLNAGIYNALVPEYLKLQQGVYNIFTVDWGRGALADYITASYRVKPVGRIVAKFVDFLHQESGIPFQNIHVIGFSMGAHVAGIAGKYVQTGRLPVIYGLDPAWPLFRYQNVNERLDIRDANYVEVIHTSVGSYGYAQPLGHVDFYVNFGYNQPGCFFNECSHFRAFQVYAHSLNNEILEGIECSGELWWDMIKHKRCLREMGRSLRMGVEGLSSSEVAVRSGLYYVTTNAQPPYKMG